MVSPAEVIWTVLAAVGLALHALGIREAWGDWRAVRWRGETRLRIAVLLCLRNEIARAWIKLTFLLVGIYALLTPQPARPEVATFQLVATWLLIAGVGVLDVMAFFDRRDRRRLLAAVRARRKVG